MNPWLYGGLCLIAYAIFCIYANRRLTKNYEELKQRRSNLSKNQFMAQMAHNVPPDVSNFLWDKVQEYIQPILSPHPDDDLIEDLCIDPDDFCIDWPEEWASLAGFHESNLPDWPKDTPLTIRNFGIWLAAGPACNTHQNL